MTNEEKINRLRGIQRCTPIHTREDARDFEALEGAIEAIETLGKIESRLRNVLKELEEGLLADNRLIAVSGMSIEELTDAFINGYRLVGPEAFKDDIPDDLRIAPKKPREQTKWIPVNEEFPKLCEEVIVTDVETSETYLSRYIGNEYWECDNGLFKNRIIAWQPKPQPYKAESESEDKG